MRIQLVFLSAFFAAAPAFPADTGCTVPFDATKKVITTPAHGYSTRMSGLHPGQPQQTEIIYSGGISGETFVKINGQWKPSHEKPADTLKREDENIRDSKSTCRYLRDEPVNGESAAVYAVHTDNDGIIGDGTVWISKARGLPLKTEMDTDIGGGPQGKSHTSTRYEYENVRPPDGVK